MGLVTAALLVAAAPIPATAATTLASVSSALRGRNKAPLRPSLEINMNAVLIEGTAFLSIAIRRLRDKPPYHVWCMRRIWYNARQL